MAKNKNIVVPYNWNGINREGVEVQGVIASSNIALAKASLRKQGIITRKIVRKHTFFFDNNNKKIISADITLFSRKLATMINAGIPLVQSLNIAAMGEKNVRMRELIGSIKKDIESGLTFAEALAKYPSFFNTIFCSLVDAGEKAGSLDTLLSKIATYKEKIETIKKKIRKALTYPIAVFIVAFLVTTALLIFVVPQFEALFNGFGATLPALTRAIVNLSTILKHYWYLIGGVFVLVVYSFVEAKKHSRHFAQFLDIALLKLPIVGKILKNAAIARFARTLSITFAAGLPLLDALRSVAAATGNSLYAKATYKIRDGISTGQQMHVAMENSLIFPSMATQMIAIGEESGTLEQMLSKIADFYEEDVNNAVDSLSTLLEPLIMSILGVLVGGLVIAMYLPIFKLGTVL